MGVTEFLKLWLCSNGEDSYAELFLKQAFRLLHILTTSKEGQDPENLVPVAGKLVCRQPDIKGAGADIPTIASYF